MSSTAIWLAVSSIPVATRAIMYWWHVNHMAEILSDDEKAPDTHRSVIIPMAGFSFAALIALAITDAEFKIDLTVPISFLLVSFSAFYLTMNLQSYKKTRQGDLVGTAFYEVATISLFLAIAHILVTTSEVWILKFLGVTGLLAWFIDHLIRYRIMWIFLSKKKLKGISNEPRSGEGQETTAE